MPAQAAYLFEKEQSRDIFQILSLWLTLLLAISIDEQVRQNAEKPGFEIGPGLEGLDGAERLQRGWESPFWP